MQPYSPFSKTFSELLPDDLAELRVSHEGWYIEYKQEVPNSSSVAKSISAFANTYGGWLFYGVQEKSKEEPVAGSFPGIPRECIDPSLQRIRQGAAMHVNPAPHFDAKVFWGPSTAMDLLPDRAIICIYVPRSIITPHVHKSGQIYRRVADGSEPKPEADRFILDQLWRRADDVRKTYASWVNRDPEFSEGEKNQPYLRLMLVADQWNERGPWLDVELDEVRRLLNPPEHILNSLPLDTIHTNYNGFSGRQLRNNDPSNLGVHWHLRRSLVSDISIPLKTYRPNSLFDLHDELEGYENKIRFIALLGKNRHVRPRIVDLNLIFNVIIGICETQRGLLNRAKWNFGYHFKFRLLNIWRTIPFIDLSNVLDTFEEFGIPMCMSNNITAPTGDDPETFQDVGQFEDEQSLENVILLQALRMFAPIAQTFGIPDWIQYEEESGASPYYIQLLQAGTRALNVQRMSAERP